MNFDFKTGGELFMADEEKKEKLGKNVEKIVEDVSKLTVVELAELVTALQDKLGVSAMPMAAAPAAAAPAAQAPEAGQEAGGGMQSVVMTNAGANKISVIKALREINQNWGLKEAKDMTEQVPVDIVKDVKAEEAKAAADKLKAAGATVEVK